MLYYIDRDIRKVNKIIKRSRERERKIKSYIGRITSSLYT